MSVHHVLDSIPYFVHAFRVATDQIRPQHRVQAREQGYAFVYAEAARRLSEQKKDLSDLRSRTGVILSATALTTAFFGSEALNRDASLVWEWVAVGCVVVVTLLVMLILIPRKGWRFDLSASILLSGYVEAEEPVDLAGMHRQLARYLEENWEQNESKLARMHQYFTWAGILLSVEVLSWLFARF